MQLVNLWILVYLRLCHNTVVYGLQSPGSGGSTTGTSTTATTTTSSSTTKPPIQVLVSGASGRTGQLVFSALLNDPRYYPKALVRSQKSAKKLQKSIPATQLDQIYICDVTTLPKNNNDTNTNTNNQPIISGFDNCQALIICTSAVPIISKLSLFKAFIKIPYNLLRRRKAIDFRSFRFIWQNQQYPELVDYYGQIAQIDYASKQLHIPHIIVVSSMGGTDPTNFLNRVGKTILSNGTMIGNGDILLWKRKAERYLINTGLDYTIIHPGGLIDTPGGVEEYVLDVNDVLLNNTKRSISREDVANLCVAAISLYQPGKTKLAFDCITRPISDDKQGKVVVPKAEQALEAFIKEGKVYNYDL